MAVVGERFSIGNEPRAKPNPIGNACSIGSGNEACGQKPGCKR